MGDIARECSPAKWAMESVAAIRLNVNSMSRPAGLIKRPLSAVALASMLCFSVVPGAQADEISDLKEIIKKLDARVKALESERARGQAAPAPAPAPAPAAATAAQPAAAAPIQAAAPVSAVAASAYIPAATMKSDESAAQRTDNAPIDPSMKGFFRLPGSDTLVKIGGYAKVDAIYDSKPIGSHDYFVTSAIPTSGPDTKRGSQFTMHAKQTRMNMDMRRDTDAGAARIYVEGDWFGNASSGFEPGSNQFQLRHAFGQLNNFAAGYSFSAFMNNDALPDTLDFEGPGSAPFLLVASARYTVKTSENSRISFAAEAPQSQVDTSGGGFAKTAFPDLTMRARIEGDAGHFQASGVWRSLGWSSDTGSKDTTSGYGLNLSGSLKTVGDDYIVAGAVWGKGIARYISDIGGSGLDAVVDPSGHLQALEEYGAYGAYTHYWTPKLRSTGVINYLGMNDNPYKLATSLSSSQYYSMNLIWNPAGSLNVGTELLYGRQTTVDGFSGNDTRLQFSVQYDFVR